LLEEIQYLRQMLADSVEERRIQMADKQQTINELTAQKAEADRSLASLNALKDNLDEIRHKAESGIIDAREANLGERSMLLESKSLLLDQQKAECDRRKDDLDRLKDDLDRREEEMRCKNKDLELELRRQVADAEFRCRAHEEQRQAEERRALQADARKEALQVQVVAVEQELQEAQEKIARWECSTEVLSSMTTAKSMKDFEHEYRSKVDDAMMRISDRRAVIAAQESALCKICYDRPISCALLPCKHHAFCLPCGWRIYNCPEPQCPLCRKAVQDLFETFAG